MATITTTTPKPLSFLSSSVFTTRPKPPPLCLKPATTRRPQKLTSITCEATTLPILSFAGDKIGTATLDLKAAPEETARAVVHRGIITDLRNKRRGTASTLTRAEVRGGGRKPYPQKKTGGARRGSNRTPLRPGGGVVFGPKPRDWSIKINRKEKRLALSTALSSAAVNTVVVEDFAAEFGRPKTKDFVAALTRWGIQPTEKTMFLVMELDQNVVLSSRNIGTMRMLTPRTLNLFDVLNADKLVLTKDSLEYLNERYRVDYDDDDDDDDGDEDVDEDEGEGN